MAEQNPASKTDRLKALLCKGRDVPIQGTDESVHVMPLRLCHLRACEEAIASAASSIGQIARAVMEKGDRSEAAIMDDVIAALPPLITGKLLCLIESDTDLGELPHWVIPPIVSAWIEESFSQGKLAGWVDTFKKMTTLIPSSPASQE